jgi:hypothetical protein
MGGLEPSASPQCAKPFYPETSFLLICHPHEKLRLFQGAPIVDIQNGSRLLQENAGTDTVKKKEVTEK